MKILGIQGSPRGVRSRTRLLVGWVLAGAEEAGAEVEMVDIADLNITPCTACESCSITGHCINDDDFPGVLSRMAAADGLVFGSPVYIDNVTGQMKIFIDRLADAIHYQVCTGSYGCALSTTWSSGGEEVVAYENHVLNYLGAYAVKGMSVALGDDERAILDAESGARQLGKRLVHAIRTKERFPDQEKFIEDNREFFAGIVEKTRESRPREYEDWVRRGWIRPS